jgi:hypothetical protein
MRVLERIATVITADPDGIAASQTPAGAGDLVLDGATVKADDGTATYDIGAAVLNPPRRVTITSAADISNRTLTIYGRDRVGTEISETLTGPNATTVTSVLVYKTVSRISISGAAAGALTVGFGAEFITPWIVLANMRGDYHWLSRVFFAAGGTVNYDIEVTSDKYLLQRSGDYSDDTHAVLAAQTANTESSNDANYAAVRLKVNATDVPVTMRVIPSRTA